MAAITIKDIMSICIYVEDYQVAYDFYSHVLGLEHSQNMGDNACFFRLNDNPMAIYLEGGYDRVDPSERSSIVSCMLSVESAPDTYKELKEFGVRFVHNEPQHLGDGNYWFRFYDPAGNILEVVSRAD